MTEGSQAPDKLCPVLEGTCVGRPRPLPQLSTPRTRQETDWAWEDLSPGPPHPPPMLARVQSHGHSHRQRHPWRLSQLSLLQVTLFKHTFHTTGLDHP